MSAPIEPISRLLADHLGTALQYRGHQPLHGGDINQSLLLNSSEGPFFVKLNKASRLAMFEAEAAALNEMRFAEAVRVPQPILAGSCGNHSFLVLEHIEMGGSSAASEEALGHQLAVMHQVRRDRFGWSRDNTIGSTPQHNRETDEWITFWREQRIAPQLLWAAEHGAPATLLQQGEELLNQLDRLLAGHSALPSMLHGDLWGGNWSTAHSGEPVLYDPALYYGDRETDLAMSELFGGFSARFYRAYNEAWPLDDGYEQRKTLYNLYHILNHFNLFRGGYGHQAEQMVRRLLQSL
jgi:protein-ribulosamine 3-kinase